MTTQNSFLYQNIRNSGKERFLTWGVIYTVMITVFFLVFATISVKELLEGFPSGPLVLLAFVFSIFSGGLAYGSLRYLRYGLLLCLVPMARALLAFGLQSFYRHPERAQFLTLWDDGESFEKICQDVEREKDISLLSGIRNVTVTPSFLFVRQKGYFELYRHQDIVSISLGNARGRILTITDKHGMDRELSQSWDEQVIPKLMELLGLHDPKPPR